MKIPTPHKVKNHQILQTIATNFPNIAAVVPDIWDAYKRYHPCRGDPRAIAPLVVPPAHAAQFKEVMEDCYKSGRVRDGLSWLSTYRLRHGHSHCPMCGAAHPKTLEHYLPRARYPEFAVYALNLVPSCMSCNGHRSSTANEPDAALPMLHPFFDINHLNAEFLQACNNGSLIAPDFAPLVLHPDNQIQARVEEHVRRSIDLDLFNTWLVDLLLCARGWATRHNTVPLMTQEVDARLSDELKLRGANTWDAAFLRWLRADEHRVKATLNKSTILCASAL